MTLEITGAETGDQLIKLLVKVRHNVRLLDKTRTSWRETQAIWQDALKNAGDDSELKDRITQGIARCKEAIMELRFDEIEIGNFTMTLCRHLDEKAERESVLDALNVGRAARNSDEIKKYGKTTADLIYVLQLENSSDRRGEDWYIPPLAMCCHLAFMNKMQTNQEFDRAAHDVMNEVFNGYWGEYQERPLLERLTGTAV